MSYRLLTPGPVPAPAEVLQILAAPMEHHRTPEFLAVFEEVLTGLRHVFATPEPVFVHAATGSGAMESAIVNCFSHGDEVLVVVSGKFGERWAEMAETYGLKVHRLNVEWGEAVDPQKIKLALKDHPEVRGVFTQACETSTGALHPVREIAEVVAQTPAILLVDAITALGAVELPMEQWQLDVVIAGSQKAFMLPTGLSFISFSKKAWAFVEKAKLPRYYFDVRRELAAYKNGESYFSTPVTHIRALAWVLKERMRGEKFLVLRNRIEQLARATHAGIQVLGLELFSKSPSPSVTAIRMPQGIDGQKVRADMEKNHHVIAMGGQDQLKGKIIRLGHMGAISDADVLAGLEALARAIAAQNPQALNLNVSDKNSLSDLIQAAHAAAQKELQLI